MGLDKGEAVQWGKGWLGIDDDTGIQPCVRAREERFASTTRRAQAAAGLLVIGLQQRLLSSIEAPWR